MTAAYRPTGDTLRIGTLASQTGVSVEALRYYEQRGLLRPSGRRASGYREYPAEAVRLVRFIKRAQALGFTLAEVEELIHLRERAWVGDAPRLLRAAADAKARDIDRRIEQLRSLRAAIGELLTACDEACTLDPAASRRRATGRASPATEGVLACPMIEALDADVPSAPPELTDLAPDDSRCVERSDRRRPPKTARRNTSQVPSRKHHAKTSNRRTP